MTRATSTTAAILLACLAPLASRASILVPTSDYLNGTSMVTFADPDEAMLNSISDSFLTIAFSSPMRAGTPRVLQSGLDANSNPVTTVTFFLNQPVSTFGFKAEPAATGKHTLTATFFIDRKSVV